MGLFGSSARLRDQSLANPQQYQPMFSPDPAQQQSIAPPMAAPQGLDPAMIRQPKPSAFGQGGMGWNIVGALGDAFSQMGGYGSPFATAQARQQQQAQEEAQWSRRQDSELSQRKAMYDYEVAHPKPVNNDTQADWEFYRQRLNPQEFETWKQNRINPPRWVQDAMGQWRQVGGAGASGPTPAPPGVTFTPMPEGGPTPPASGTFPRR